MRAVMRKGQRKRLKDPDEIQQVQDDYISALEEGETQAEAAWYADCSVSTIRRWASEDPEFRARIAEVST